MDINYFDLSGGINQASTKTDITTEALSGKKETRYFWNYPNKNLLLVCMRWSLIVLLN